MIGFGLYSNVHSLCYIDAATLEKHGIWKRSSVIGWMGLNAFHSLCHLYVTTDNTGRSGSVVRLKV